MNSLILTQNTKKIIKSFIIDLETSQNPFNSQSSTEEGSSQAVAKQSHLSLPFVPLDCLF